MKIAKKDTKKLYNLPEKVIFCKKCTISNQRPRITFDNNGVCSACQFSKIKNDEINWKSREEELKTLLDNHRKSNGEYDVIVPCSGGKDAAQIAHKLKYKYGMNPLTVTWSPMLYTDIGIQNLHNMIRIGNVANQLGTPPGDIHKELTKISFKILGDPFQPFIYGQANYPMQVALDHNIPLVMYGENGEVEYGGDMKNAHSPTRDYSKDPTKHYFSGIAPGDFKKHGIIENDLVPYLSPPFEKLDELKLELHFWSYYEKWIPQENYYYCVENTGFQANKERSEGTYSKYASLDDKLDGFHYYLSYIKFGLGRATSDSAHEIRDGHITREEGIQLVKKFDGEFPQKYYKTFLDYCDIDESLFNEVIDSWRSDHLWEKKNGKWSLKNKIWSSE
jgi:N-acetyl sugar amidotransferase